MATTTTTTVASPVDFETYGDYAPPAGAYRREGNLTSLIYPIDGRISDDGSTEFAAEAGRYHLYFSLVLPMGAASAHRAQAARARRRGVVVGGRSGARRTRLGVPRRRRPRSRPGQRVHAAPRRLPRDRPHLRRPRLRARALGPRLRQAGEQPLRDDDRRPRNVLHRVGRPVGRAVPGGAPRRDRRGERRDRARPRRRHVRGPRRDARRPSTTR